MSTRDWLLKKLIESELRNKELSDANRETREQMVAAHEESIRWQQQADEVRLDLAETRTELATLKQFTGQLSDKSVRVLVLDTRDSLLHEARITSRSSAGGETTLRVEI